MENGRSRCETDEEEDEKKCSESLVRVSIMESVDACQEEVRCMQEQTVLTTDSCGLSILNNSVISFILFPAFQR